MHLDRWLPFLVLHRSDDPANSIARRVAINSPAYLIWSPRGRSGRGRRRCAAIVAEHARAFRPCPARSRCSTRSCAGRSGRGRARPAAAFAPSSGRRRRRPRCCAGDALVEAHGEVEIDLRRCRRSSAGRGPILEPSVAELLDSDLERRRSVARRCRRSTARPDGAALSAADPRPRRSRCGDALLRAACAFIADGSAAAPRHYRVARPQRVPRRRAPRRPQARPRSRAASISCCRSRRSTPPRRCAEFLEGGSERRRSSATGR